MNETAKAMRRRYVEDKTDVFPWMRKFRGVGLDVGCGPDKLPFEKCKGFDKENGDANSLSKYIATRSLNYIHSSQSLEHMLDPKLALYEWLACVKPKGFIICTVPDWCLYEHMKWPSVFNDDHKSTWSLWLKDSPAPIHCWLPNWLKQFPVKLIRCELMDTNYNYKLPATIDQTQEESDGVEAFIEFVIQKL